MKIKKLSKEEFESIYKKVPRLCVDIIFKSKEGILFSKRNVKPYLGKWCIPGGTVLLNEKLEDAVKRISKEKYGVDIKEEKFLGIIEFLTDPNSHCLSAVFLVKIKNKDTRNFNKEDFLFINNIPKNFVKEQKEFLIKNLILVN